MADETITRESTAKKFMKAHTDQRISPESVTILVEGLNSLTKDLVEKAESLSKEDDRSTILDRDMKEALRSVGGGVDPSPEGLFKVIEKMNATDVGKIALLVAQWVKEHKRI